MKNWVNKLTVQFIEEEEDGSGTISIEWEENDPDLVFWESLGKEGQEEFIMQALYTVIKNTGLIIDDT